MTTHAGFYWKLLQRRAPAMLALFLLASGIGVALAMRLPTTYQTGARLIVEGAQIPDKLATSTVQTEASEEIQIIREQLLTRANLLEIANKFQVLRGQKEMTPDEIVTAMRAATRITSSNARVEPIIVSVGFEARTGQIAANVVNEYVTRIIAANVEQRTGRAEDTLEFFEQEVERLSAALDEKNARISQFQRDNANAMPENQPFRLARQAQLQERLLTAQRERAALIEQKARVVAVYEATGRLSATGQQALSPEESQLQQLEADLSAALAVYSETNPRVVTLKNQIAQLKARVAANAGAAGGETDPGIAAAAADPTGQTALLDLQLSQIDSQIRTLDTDITAAEAELASLAEAISESPLNAIALQGLQRELENVQGQYDRAVARLADASTGERIEVSARGQRITLIEAATVPNAPASPNRPLIAAAGAGAGLALAVGLFLLLELMNRTIRAPFEITKGLGIKPLATIPYMESRRHILVRRSLQVASVLIVLIGIPIGLWAIDAYYMPLDLLADRILTRLGLA
jgi:polysaccharide chain length determinant protein (PEP-CTERM system associated)